jgi:hypothetical protein
LIPDPRAINPCVLPFARLQRARLVAEMQPSAQSSRRVVSEFGTHAAGF